MSLGDLSQMSFPGPVYLPSAFSFSSNSLSSGHFLERRVWARSPTPPTADELPERADPRDIPRLSPA